MVAAAFLSLYMVLLLKSLHGPGLTTCVPSFDCDSGYFQGGLSLNHHEGSLEDCHLNGHGGLLKPNMEDTPQRHKEWVCPKNQDLVGAPCEVAFRGRDPLPAGYSQPQCPFLGPTPTPVQFLHETHPLLSYGAFGRLAVPKTLGL